MGDSPTQHQNNRAIFKNYPVDIRALRIDWILDTGLPFFEALNGSPSALENRGLKQVLKFIYEPMKTHVVRKEFPVYLVQLFSFYLMAHLYDYNIVLLGSSDGEINDSWEKTTVFAIARVMAVM
jgi:hypothetical protein